MMGACIALIASAVLPSPMWATVAFAAAVFLAGRGLVLTYPHDIFGLCNTVTLGRAALVALLFGATMAPREAMAWLVFGIGAVALAMDGIDGWLARRSGLESDFGARFDMETDAALGAVLSLWLLLLDITGIEVLALGFMRYGFVAASVIDPRLRAPLPPSLRRKTICVVQIGALLVLAFPLLPDNLIVPVSSAAVAALTYSFAADVLWLERRTA